MCFTVNVNIVKEELESRYGSNLLDPEKYNPSYYYHAFAYPDLPIAYNNHGSMQMSIFKWGLIPGWIKDVDEAMRIRAMTHNARSETIDVLPSFAESFKSRRCLVPVAGFFEWQHLGSAKRPWYISSKESAVISLAGIYDRWYDEVESKDNYTFSIITTRANKRMSEIHNSKRRMPVIVPAEKEEEWLSGDIDNVKDLFNPLDDELLTYHTVSPSLGKQSASKNRPEIIQPYQYPEEPTLF